MEIKYGVTGKDRKALVMDIAEITGADAIYKGVPTCSYEVDYFTVDKSGTLIFDDSADSEEVEQLIAELAIRGFVGEQEEPESEIIENGFSISLPIDKVNVYNLQNLLESKQTFICKALGVNCLPIDVEETRVTFPWFRELPDADKVRTYSWKIRLIELVNMTNNL